MASLGLGWDDLHAINPRLVMLSSQLLGSTGPRASWRGYGPSVQAYGGLLHLWAFPDGEGWPGSPSNFPDLLVGELLAAFGLAALWERERTGQGTHVDLSQAEVVANLLGDLLLAESLTPGSVGPDGNDDERGSVWGPFRCVGDEEWVVVCSPHRGPRTRVLVRRAHARRSGGTLPGPRHPGGTDGVSARSALRPASGGARVPRLGRSARRRPAAL